MNITKALKKCIKYLLVFLFLWIVFIAASLILPPLRNLQMNEGQKTEKNASEEGIPEENTAEESVPEKGTAEENVSEKGTAGESVSEKGTAEESISKENAPEAGSERVRSIDCNQEALLWRLRLIASAKERIVLATFDFRDDNSGTDIMSALLQAADRGVKVQLLIDGMNGDLQLRNSKHFQALTAHELVEARFYNPINLLQPWVNNYRMHDKYLIADNFAYILGGRNTNDLFLGNYAEEHNEDRDILVYEAPHENGKTEEAEKVGDAEISRAAGTTGESLSQLQEYFEQIWELPCCKPYGQDSRQETASKEKAMPAAYLKAAKELYARYEKLCVEYPEMLEEIDWKAETIETERVTLHTNPIEPDNKAPVLWNKMSDEMKLGKDILVQTPYIICSDEMYQDLEQVCDAGGHVEILLNAVEIGSNPFGCTDYLNEKERILETGSNVCEYLGPHALHTKTILVDDSLSIVGSCNLDMRSVYLDTEMMLFIESKELNQSLREQIGMLKQHGRQILTDGTVIEGEHYAYREQGIGRQMLYGLLRIVIRPFRHLL